MPTTTSRKRPSTSVAVPFQAIETVTSSLHELPEKSKEVWSLREAVSLLREPITIALNRGYSYEEVAELLAKEGISISVSSLKRYLSVARQQDAPGKQKRRTRKSRQVRTDAESQDQDQDQDQEGASESELFSLADLQTSESTNGAEQPTKRRTRKTAAAQEADNKSESRASGRTKSAATKTPSARRRRSSKA